jgi:hypothetical protein
VDTARDYGSIEMAVEIKEPGLQALIAGRVTGTCQALSAEAPDTQAQKVDTMAKGSNT